MDIDYISDPTLTTERVAEVMELMNDWSSLDSRLFRNDTDVLVPDSQHIQIQRRCSTRRETANECASYYIHCHHQPSWTHLASHLYHRRESAAVEKLKPFLPLRGISMMYDYDDDGRLLKLNSIHNVKFCMDPCEVCITIRNRS